MTACPIAMPIRCAVCRTPPAVLPATGSTRISVSAWFGVMTAPDPAPMRNSAGASAAAPCPARTASATAPTREGEASPTSRGADRCG